MGAISDNVPAIYVPAGPMLRGHWKDKTLGSGTDVWKYWADRRAGMIGDREWGELEDGIARSAGTCMTMGTASTMMSLAEAMGLSLPGASSIPAVDASHARMATDSGRRIVEHGVGGPAPVRHPHRSRVRERHHHRHGDRRLDQRDYPSVAMARRAGVNAHLDTFDQISERHAGDRQYQALPAPS